MEEMARRAAALICFPGGMPGRLRTRSSTRRAGGARSVEVAAGRRRAVLLRALLPSTQERRAAEP
eukprot:11838868-Alexandrium_andersonii.AAC.1